MLTVKEILPNNEEHEKNSPIMSFFLAGTIDNGDSIDWQTLFIKKITKLLMSSQTFENTNKEIHIYNPRRKEGFNSDKEQMLYQINWELDHLEKSTMIIMNLLEGSKSPISLLELGLFAKTGKLVVICPPTFYRYENVYVVCERYGVKLFNSEKEFFTEIPIK